MTRIRDLDRRHFLVGAGGFTLAVPFLSSLVPRAAHGQTSPRQKRFVQVMSDHGGVFPENFNPRDPPEMTVRALHPAQGRIPEHRIRWGSLAAVAERSGGSTRLSNALQAPSTLLTPRMLERMNVVLGFDVTTYIGHNRGMILGNFGANDQGESLWDHQMATIDQLISRAPGFARTPPRERTINLGLGSWATGSHIRSSASAEVVDGVPTPVQAVTDPRVMWDRLFAGQQGGGGARRTSVVDRVIEHYRGLMSGAFGDASRLSALDRERLSAHVDRLAELDRKLNVRVDCGSVQPPRSASSDAERLEQQLDLIAAALSCGASHVAALTVTTENVSQDVGWTNWHEQVAHGGGGNQTTYDEGYQRVNWRAHQQVFERAFLGLAQRLDLDQDDGKTVLDDTLLVWTQEFGPVTHAALEIPVVTLGSAGGFFETGRLVDYRNRDHDLLRDAEAPNRHPGVLYNQWLANVMLAMGLSPADWAGEMRRVQPEAYQNGVRGYGMAQYHPQNFWRSIDLQRDVWPLRYYQVADQPLPGLVVGA
jgi:hypothetical protein